MQSFLIRSTLGMALGLLSMTGSASAEQALQFHLDGKSKTVLPLGYNQKSVLALTQNGFMVELNPSKVKNPKLVPSFRPYSQAEIRGELLKEFGKSFEVTGTGNYLVVHPRGSKDLWANRFEELYRSMVHFFRTRGYPMRGKTQFPLVGVVFYSKSQYLTYSRRVLKANANGSLGVYMPTTNRIYLYDATHGRGKATPRWEQNLATIMHEAAHQTAFNTGVHVRGAETPHWVAEGIGCLFEARGIYNTFKYRQQEDRLNIGRLNSFQKFVKDDAQQMVAQVVTSDKSFQLDPHRAYATSWALTFYLSERKPREYIRYLKLVARQKPASRYTAKERLRDFTQVFGKDFKMLSIQLVRYIDGFAKDR